MYILSHYIRTIRGGAMTMAWPPKILKISSIYINIYIYNYFNVLKIYPTKIRVGPPKYLN